MGVVDLSPDQRRQMTDHYLGQLRAQRFQHEMNIAGWNAIPEELRDGSEAPAVEEAHRAIAILDAQIDGVCAAVNSR